ncbi:MAG TPA: PilZ domain-containing protein [Candidatus Omnitrophota bacterium]|nr:PilZ domain-containing protein [Candidatus Omnitrophota bacterium]HPD85452.1 PilZ domain-containing protein [Candidatus Omnitrophota bacterium]HRZ04047.1 PilZ domain-containing protein [Candidatus Omnitrophota bacterium]
MKIIETERRRYARYDTEAKVYFRVTYDIKTRVKFRVIDQGEGKISPAEYSALSKNVSAEGLCFTAGKKLNGGDILYIEVYLPGREEPIRMEGEVRWCHPDRVARKKVGRFNTGVKLMTINGFSVAKSIYRDTANHIVWSKVLDSIFSNFKNFVKEQNKPNRSVRKSAKK